MLGEDLNEVVVERERQELRALSRSRGAHWTWGKQTRGAKSAPHTELEIGSNRHRGDGRMGCRGRAKLFVGVCGCAVQQCGRTTCWRTLVLHAKVLNCVEMRVRSYAADTSNPIGVGRPRG